MTTKLVVVLGNPTPIYPLRITTIRTLVASTLQQVKTSRTVLASVASPTLPGSRFYGDPGVGNRYVGMEANGSLTDFLKFEGELNKAVQLRRFYNPGGAVASCKTAMYTYDSLLA